MLDMQRTTIPFVLMAATMLAAATAGAQAPTTDARTAQSPALATTVLPFLNGESGAPSWAEQVKQEE